MISTPRTPFTCKEHGSRVDGKTGSSFSANQQQSPEYFSWKDFLNMYCLLLWDKESNVNDHDRSLKSIEVPINLARKFFLLEAKNFPILSSLSFDDYGLFSDDQLIALRQEIKNFAEIDKVHVENIEALIDLVNEAEARSKSVMFDPFK